MCAHATLGCCVTRECEFCARGLYRKTTEKVADKKTGKKTYGPYKAGEFRKLYREFIEAEKASGKSWKDANKAWQMSSKRADLWAEMPTPEKKKRRFV